jgi:hypothetical protein
MIYEYDFQDIGLDEEQKKLVELGMANIENLNAKIKDILNKRGCDGWEPLYPFSVPLLWFRRQTTVLAVSQKKRKN